MLNNILLLTFLTLTALQLNAFPPPQTPTSTTPGQNAVLYLRSAGSQALLYYGKEQLKYPLHYQHHPYFQHPEYTIGEITHNNIHYTNVMIRLDLHRDEIVVSSPNPPYNIVINASQVQHTLLHGTSFLSLPLPGKTGETTQYGYFLLHYNGKYQVLEKINVSLEKVIEWGQLSMVFTPNSTCYISINNAIHPIRSLQALQRLMPDYKRDIRRITRENRLSFRKNPVLTLTLLMQNLAEK